MPVRVVNAMICLFFFGWSLGNAETAASDPKIVPLPKPSSSASLIEPGSMTSAFQSTVEYRDAQGAVLFKGTAKIHPLFQRFDSLRGSASPFSMIIRRDKNVVWLIDPSNNTYVEYPFNEEAIKRELTEMRATQQLRNVRQTSVAGHPVVEQSVALAMDLAGGRTTRSQTAWRSTSLNTWVSLREAGGARVDLQEITQRRLSSRSFNLPRGCRKVDTLPAKPSDTNDQLRDSTAGKAIPRNLPRQPEVEERVGRFASSGDTSLAACQSKCKNDFTSNFFFASLGGWNPIGWLVTGVKYDICMTRCTGSSGSAAGAWKPPPRPEREAK